ncbi:penicillin-binding protein activator [Bdellovibrionota bacterium FG-1]
MLRHLLPLLALSLTLDHIAPQLGWGGQLSEPMPLKTTNEAPTASAAENRDFREISTLYARGAFEATLIKLDIFERRYPQSPLAPQVANLHGLSFLLTQRPSQAIAHFKHALAVGADHPTLIPYLNYNLADAQFEAKQLDDARKTASTIDLDRMDKENRLKVLYLRARIHSQRGLPLEAAREALNAGKLALPQMQMTQATPGETRNAIANILEQNLKAIKDPGELEDLYQGSEDSTLADAVLFRLGTIELENGANEKGTTHLKLLMTRFADSPHYAQAAAWVQNSAKTNPSPSPTSLTPPGRDGGPVDGKAVGILLPMRGKFAKFGTRTLQGIELGFKIFNANEPDNKITLFVEDSGEDPETTIKALDKLVKQHHVIAVIGPLLSKGIDQVTSHAEELGIPLISLARHPGIQSDFIFQAGLTIKLQAQEIARFAIEKLGLKRFAIIYPRDKTGEDSMQRFWDAVESYGGKIRGVESFNPGETDFRQAIDRLSGLYYTDAREKELEELARQRQLNNIKKRTRKTEQYFALRPEVDYDAVFVPEEPKVAGQILPTFAYRDVDHIKFLGTSAWNSPELSARAANYAESAYFSDAWIPDSSSPAARKYAEHFKATFDQEPGTMDALAYDSARLLDSILSQHSSIGRSDLRDKLKEIKMFPGVTGQISYKEGQLSRNLKILTVKGPKIIEAAVPALSQPEK